MKLEELTGIDSYRKVKNMKSDNVSDIWSNNTNKDFEIIDPLLDILESEGFIVINSSVYAIVLLGNNSVIKFSLYDKYLLIIEFSSSFTSSIVPCDIIYPPLDPATGPNSII